MRTTATDDFNDEVIASPSASSSKPNRVSLGVGDQISQPDNELLPFAKLNCFVNVRDKELGSSISTELTKFGAHIDLTVCSFLLIINLISRV